MAVKLPLTRTGAVSSGAAGISGQTSGVRAAGKNSSTGTKTPSTASSPATSNPSAGAEASTTAIRKVEAEVAAVVDTAANGIEAGASLTGFVPMLAAPLAWVGFKKPTHFLEQNVHEALGAGKLKGLAKFIPQSMRANTVGSAMMNGSFAATSAFGMAHTAQGFWGQFAAFKAMCSDLAGEPVSTLDILLGRIPPALKSERTELLAGFGMNELLGGASLLLSVRALKGKDAHAMAWIGLQGAQMLAGPALFSNALLAKYTECKATQAAGQQLTVGMYAEVLDQVDSCKGHKDGPNDFVIQRLAENFAKEQKPIAEVLKASADGSLDTMIAKAIEESKKPHHHTHASPTSHFTSKVLNERASSGAAHVASKHDSFAAKVSDRLATSSSPMASV